MSDIFIHPFNSKFPIPEDTEWLMVGAAPPPRFDTRQLREGDVDFFYGCASNQLWKDILAEIYGESFSVGDADERLYRMVAALKRHRHWMVDILESYSRKVADSCCDADLEPRKFLNLKGIFSGLRQLKGLWLTSAKVTCWVGQALRQQGLLAKGQFKRIPVFGLPIERRLICLSEAEQVRTLEVITLPSPSRASNRRQSMSLSDKIAIYRRFMCPHATRSNRDAALLDPMESSLDD